MCVQVKGVGLFVVCVRACVCLCLRVSHTSVQYAFVNDM